MPMDHETAFHMQICEFANFTNAWMYVAYVALSMFFRNVQHLWLWV